MSTFYIASIRHTHKDHEHVIFWSRFHRGYTPVVGGSYAGLYCFGEAVSLNDGLDCVAVPAAVVQDLLSPEPYFRTNKGEAARFYDQRGGVIHNTRAMWSALIAGSLVPGRHVAKIKPEVFRGKTRSFAHAEAEAETACA